MYALYHPDPDGCGEASVGTMSRVSGVTPLLHSAAERQRAPGNVSRVTLCHVSLLTCHTCHDWRAADTEAAAAGAARGEGGGAGGQEQGVLQEAEVLRVLHRLRHYRLLLQYVAPAPAAQLTTTIQSSLCTWSYPTVSTTSGHRSITLSTSPPARTRKLERKYHWCAKLMIFGNGAGESDLHLLFTNYRNTIICATQLI